MKAIYRMRSLLIVLLLLIVAGCSDSKFETYKNDGIEAFEDGKYSTARRHLTAAYQLNSSDKDVLYYLGVSFQMDGRYDSAYHYIRHADRLYPNDLEITKAIHKLAVDMGEWRSALSALRALFELGEKEEDYYEELQQYCAGAGYYANAYYYSKLLLQQDPENLEYYLNFARNAAAIDSLWQAIDFIDSAIVKFGPDPSIIIRKGYFYTIYGQHAQAEDVYRGLIAVDTTSSPNLKLNLANALSSQDNRAKKREALDLYYEIQDRFSEQFKIDSITAVLETELGVKK